MPTGSREVHGRASAGRFEMSRILPASDSPELWVSEVAQLDRVYSESKHLHLLSEENGRSVTTMTGRDVTTIFSAYRECARHAWNSSFAGKPLSMDDARLIRRADKILFSVMVISRLKGSDFPASTKNRFKVTPIASTIPILVNREIPPGGYWDHPVKTVTRTEIELYFHSFFDWEDFGVKDFQYIRVVLNCDDRELCGRHGLVLWGDARIETHGMQ